MFEIYDSLRKEIQEEDFDLVENECHSNYRFLHRRNLIGLIEQPKNMIVKLNHSSRLAKFCWLEQFCSSLFQWLSKSFPFLLSHCQSCIKSFAICGQKSNNTVLLDFCPQIAKVFRLNILLVVSSTRLKFAYVFLILFACFLILGNYSSINYYWN